MARPQLWTESRKRKLLRLYLCTTMRHENICKMLSEGKFQPGVRRAQGLLNELLGPNYAELRPKDRAHMRKRAARLRECRALATRRRQVLKAQITQRRQRQGDGSVAPPSAPHHAFQVSDESQLGFPGTLAMIANPSISYPSIHRSSAMVCTSLHETALPDQAILTSHSTTELNKSGGGYAANLSIESSTAELLNINPAQRDTREDGHAMWQESVNGIRHSLAMSITSLKRLSSRHTSSFIEECFSLKNRLSVSTVSSSWRSSIASSLAPNFALKRTTSIASSTSSVGALSFSCPDQGSHIGEPDLLSNKTIIPCCCSRNKDCIHQHSVYLFKNCYNSAQISQLLSAINVNATDSFGNSPLHMAAYWGAGLPIFHSLIKANADVRCINAAGQTFLHVLDAATHLLMHKNDFSDLLLTLKFLNFQFDARDHHGRSVLLGLLKRGVSFLSALLLERLYEGLANEEVLWNACLVQDNSGDSAVEYLRNVEKCFPSAHFKSNTDDLLEKCVPSCPPSLFPPKLLSPGAFRKRSRVSYSADDIRIKLKGDDGGPYTLHELAETCNLATIPKHERLGWRLKRLSYLIRAGLDPDGYDDRGFTPLLAFVNFSDEGEDPDTAELVKRLIANNANIHRRDRRGETALSLAVQRGLKETTSILMECGAKPCTRSANGTSVLWGAYRRWRGASRDPQRYGTTAACLATIIDGGAVPEPSLFEEWSMV